MRHKRKNIPSRIVFCLGVFFVFLSFAAVSMFSGQTRVNASLLNEQQDQEPEVFALLSGFEPGTKVRYRAFGADIDTFTASGVVDENGDLSLLSPPNMKGMKNKIRYSMDIGEYAERVSVTFHFDPRQGRMSFSGEFVRDNGDIEFAAAKKVLKTRADWAGLFEETGIKIPQNVSKKDPIQVSFFNNDVASDADNYQSPAVIQVLTAPGGGQVGSGGVNNWSESNCGLYPLSTCDTGAVNSQNDSWVENFVLPMQLMAEQLTVVGMQEMTAIAMFFDAKDQLEAQREHQRLKAQAVKDYHPSGGRRHDGTNGPSGQMCRVGSFMKGIADTEYKAKQDHLALSTALMTTYTNVMNHGTAYGPENDFKNRLEQYKEIYCDPMDSSKGLELLCDHDAGGTGTDVGATDLRRANADVAYGRTIEFPYTLDVDFLNTDETEDEEDVLALARNLYWPVAMAQVTDERIRDNAQYYQRVRHLMALTNLAHNSYAKQVAMKARAPDPQNAGATYGWAHMKAMMREFGLTDAQIEEYYGERPSYHMQMEVLTKKIYQNPDFYTNLYDKPANIDRIHTALEAIKLMQMRDHYEASLRREMLVSGMIEDELATDAEILQGELIDPTRK
ncbi:MAG: hypothetical protein JKY71_02825 [Alphaproteobacteria bacterium]|nr:hypothetical protein [Alphaproteobacteria bacterium]